MLAVRRLTTGCNICLSKLVTLDSVRLQWVQSTLTLRIPTTIFRVTVKQVVCPSITKSSGLKTYSSRTLPTDAAVCGMCGVNTGVATDLPQVQVHGTVTSQLTIPPRMLFQRKRLRLVGIHIDVRLL